MPLVSPVHSHLLACPLTSSAFSLFHPPGANGILNYNFAGGPGVTNSCPAGEVSGSTQCAATIAVCAPGTEILSAPPAALPAAPAALPAALPAAPADTRCHSCGTPTLPSPLPPHLLPSPPGCSCEIDALTVGDENKLNLFVRASILGRLRCTLLARVRRPCAPRAALSLSPRAARRSLARAPLLFACRARSPSLAASP